MSTRDHLSLRIIHDMVQNPAGRQHFFRQHHRGAMERLTYGVVIELFGKIALPCVEDSDRFGLSRHNLCSHGICLDRETEKFGETDRFGLIRELLGSESYLFTLDYLRPRSIKIQKAHCYDRP